MLAACSGGEAAGPVSEASPPASSVPAATTTLRPIPPTSVPGAPPTTTTTTTSPTTTTSTTTTLPPPVTARIVLVGDVMLGRGVARQVRDDPDAVFAGVRDIVAGADIAALNIESPLTTRPHIAINTNQIKADPATAGVLAQAGFDVASVANNHATDSGRSTVLDTIAALEAVGIAPVGGGPDRATAFTPLVLDHEGLRIAFVAFDVTLAGWPAQPNRPGVAHWDAGLAEDAVRAAAAGADVVVASIHGGVEYRTTTDRRLAAIAEQLASWGADVVWGHGPHVAQPVYAIDSPTGRPVVVATSLGNFLFDMRAAGTREGPLLEVEVDAGGVRRYRVGDSAHPERRVEFGGWRTGAGTDADGWIPLLPSEP